MPTGTPQGTSKADGNLLINAASRVLIDICIPLLCHCLKYTWFYAFLGREGIVLGMYIKVLASEKKSSGYSFVNAAFVVCSFHRQNMILLGVYSEVQDYTGIQDGNQHFFEDLCIQDGKHHKAR